MKSIAVVTMVALALGGIAIAANAAGEDAGTRVRIFHLQGLDAREGLTLLRAGAQVRQVASVDGRDVLIAAGTTATLDRCEELLRERGGLERAVEPHGAVDLAAPPGAETATREFRAVGDGARTAVVVLRAIYRVPELTDDAGNRTLTVRATPAVLDACEAALRELGLIEGARHSVSDS